MTTGYKSNERTSLTVNIDVAYIFIEQNLFVKISEGEREFRGTLCHSDGQFKYVVFYMYFITQLLFNKYKQIKRMLRIRRINSYYLYDVHDLKDQCKIVSKTTLAHSVL